MVKPSTETPWYLRSWQSWDYSKGIVSLRPAWATIFCIKMNYWKKERKRKTDSKKIKHEDILFFLIFPRTLGAPLIYQFVRYQFFKILSTNTINLKLSSFWLIDLFTLWFFINFRNLNFSFLICSLIYLWFSRTLLSFHESVLFVVLLLIITTFSPLDK